jgi:hypothetical protein
MTSDRLQSLRDSTAEKKSNLEGLIGISVNSRTPGEDTLRQTITDAIRADNRVLQRVNEDGRLQIAPPSAAAVRVSEPGPIEWPEPSMPWERDPYTGDWYRADKVFVCDMINACVRKEVRQTKTQPATNVCTQILSCMYANLVYGFHLCFLTE